MDITPMIDITFLLLIFFIVATKISTNKDIHLPPAEHGINVVQKDSIVISVKETRDGVVTVSGAHGSGEPQALSANDVEAQAQAVTQFVTDSLRQADTRPQVILMADRNVKHRIVAAIARAASSAGEISLYVAVLEEQEKSS
ncbi:MAG: biopolymer transporter ExbD [Planctomycetota bacterium]|nr:biopolymer transporter ExbD [Planctomycetota bacterium]MDA1179483.1 biopolymer transporter ExbD [Planctomycetota bacterium]